MRSDTVALRIFPNSLPFPRIGFSIKLQGAVHRNRIRRQLTSLCRERLASINGLDVIVSVDTSEGVPAFNKLAKDFGACLGRLGSPVDEKS